MSTGQPGAIDAYLDQLFDHMSGSGAAGRRLLAEAEDHLWQAANEALSRGFDTDTAQREAVARFGNARHIAAAVSPSGTQFMWAARRFAVGGWLLVGVALLAYGLSGLLTWTVGWPYIRLLIANNMFGTIHASYWDQNGVETAMSICTQPHTPGPPCVVVSHDYLQYVGGGSLQVTAFLWAMLLGACLLAALVVARRYTRLGLATWTPPRTGPTTVLAAFAGLAAAFLLFNGTAGMINGLQAWALSCLVTGVVCVVTATLAWRLRHPSQPHTM